VSISVGLVPLYCVWDIPLFLKVKIPNVNANVIKYEKRVDFARSACIALVERDNKWRAV
jgi:hypothetical protein